MARRKRRPVPIVDVLGQLLGKLQEEKHRGTGSAALEIFRAFERIGPPVTEHSEPAQFRSGILTLQVNGSTWLTELTFLQKNIVDRINELLGRKAVRGVRLRLGQVKPRPPAVPPLRVLTSREAAEIATWTEGIKDDAVRAAVARAATTSLARGPTEGEPPSGPPGPRMTPPQKIDDGEPELTYGFGQRQVDRWKERRDRLAAALEAE